jgi:hypothetical protein
MGRPRIQFELAQIPPGHRIDALLRSTWKPRGARGTMAEFVTVRCSCGVRFETRAACLRDGRARSCGCGQFARYGRPVKHGLFAGVDKCHPLSSTWINMIARCYSNRNGSYKDYGARGITVCKRWRGLDGFAAFVSDMGARPVGASLDRINNDKGYSPKNCRWATRKEQQRNTRWNRRFAYAGKTRSVSEWAELRRISRSCLNSRLEHGWPIAQALGFERRSAA